MTLVLWSTLRSDTRALARRHSLAFTLLEVLVALMVVSVGLLGVMAAVSVGSSAASNAVRRQEATGLAQQQLALAVAQPREALAPASGSSGRCNWEVSYQTRSHQLVVASVAVTWHQQGEVRSYRLSQVFLPRRAQQ